MNIINKIKSSLHLKILVAFLVIGIIPYFLITLYFFYLKKEDLLQQKLQTYTLQIKQTKSLLQNRLTQLQEEVIFLSKLELFDDMISNDIDHRISRMLELKSKGFKEENITFIALNQHHIITASSNPTLIGKKKFLEPNTKIVDKNILFSTPLKASFDDRELGYLIALYPLKNLKSYIVHAKDINFIIKNSKKTLISSDNSQSKTEYTTIKTELENALVGYELIYMISNEKIFDFINRFLFYLTLLLLFGIGLIVYISKKLTKQIVTPITLLTDTAKEIIETNRYDLFVKSYTTDETNELACAFNHLIKTTALTLNKLDTQSNLRMQRFIDLTNMFNHITKTEDKDACIALSIKKLNTVIPNSLSFSKILIKESKNIPIKLHDFNTNKEKLYGYLVIDKESFDDKLQSRFFDSVASMIALQIERIGLIAKIKSASDAKTSFISNMSHELRTPLNAIIGFSQYMITYESLNDDQLDTISKIERSAMHLLSMINNILDIAKIEAGKIDINYSDINLFNLLKECEELISPMADEKGLKITLSTKTTQKQIIKTDKKLLKQVLINLLSNAVKFTQTGTIEIDLKRENNFVIITITDSGIGIKKEELAKVFSEFVQLKNTNQTKHKGTGLGLPLSLNIIKALGGKLKLESEGKGHGVKAILKLKYLNSHCD